MPPRSPWEVLLPSMPFSPPLPAVLIFEADTRRTTPQKTKPAGRRSRNIDNAATHKGASVVYADNDRATIEAIAHPDPRAKWQIAMSRRQAVRIHALAAGRAMTIKRIPRSAATLRCPALLCNHKERQKNHANQYHPDNPDRPWLNPSGYFHNFVHMLTHDENGVDHPDP